MNWHFPQGKLRMVTTIMSCVVLCIAVLSGCSPLNPLGGEEVVTSKDWGTTVGTPRSIIKSATWNLAYVSRVQVPFGEIDPLFLDGKVPETVNFETQGTDITQHRVLDWGQLQLKDNGFFRFILQYSRYAVRPGVDIGPTALCSADMRGLYSVRDGTILLYPERFPTDHVKLQLDANGALRTLELPTNCSGVDGGNSFESNILLKNLVMDAVFN